MSMRIESAVTPLLIARFSLLTNFSLCTFQPLIFFQCLHIFTAWTPSDMFMSSGLEPSLDDAVWVSIVGGRNIPERHLYPGTASNNSCTTWKGSQTSIICPISATLSYVPLIAGKRGPLLFKNHPVSTALRPLLYPAPVFNAVVFIGLFSSAYKHAQISHPENISSPTIPLPFLLQAVFWDKWSACEGFFSSWSLANLLECGSSSRPPIGKLSPRRSPQVWLPNPVGILSS